MPHIDPYNPLDLEALGASLLRELERHPVYAFEELPDFVGAGIYALYYVGSSAPYASLGVFNRKQECRIPIYVGRSKDSGARQGLNPFEPVTSKPLHGRVKQHQRSIASVANLSADDFRVRVLVVMPIWIPLAEAMAIRQYRPLWNSQLQGFGIHAPGAGRDKQKRSDWDILHPGRGFAAKLTGAATTTQSTLLAQIDRASRDAVRRLAARDPDIDAPIPPPPGQAARDGVPDLPHRLAPSAVEHVLVGEGLQPRCFAHAEVAYSAVGAAQHVLAARNAVHAGLERLRRGVQRRTRMPWV